MIDVDAIESNERDRLRLREMLDTVNRERKQYQVRQLLEKATDHMRADRFAQALPLLNEAAGIDPDQEAIYFLRCQCNLAQDNVHAAQQDLEAFKQHASNLDEARETVESLEKTVQERSELISKFGSEALKLRAEANEAFGSDRFDDAAGLLRRARECCAPAGRPELERELAIVLTNWSVREVDKVMQNPLASEATKLKACRNALTRLEEAHRADPSSSHAKQNLDSLRELIGNMSQRTQMVAEFGGEHVLEIRSKAIEAFNNNRFDEAIDCLRQALAAASFAAGRSKLESELSRALSAAAVTMINDAGTHVTPALIAKARATLEEALQLDPTNQQASTNLMILKRMML